MKKFYIYSVDRKGNIFYLGREDKSRCTVDMHSSKSERACISTRATAEHTREYLDSIFAYGQTRHYIEAAC